jgi:uncharacterized repeat protein (TIGR02543 family)
MSQKHRLKRDRNRRGLLTVGVGSCLAICLTAGVLTATTSTSAPVTYNPDYTCAVPFLLQGSSATIANTGVTVTATTNTAVQGDTSATYLYQSNSRISTTLTFSPPIPAIKMTTRNHADATLETLTFTGSGGSFTGSVTNSNTSLIYDTGDEFTGMLASVAIAYTYDTPVIDLARGSYLDMFISCVGLTPSTQTVTGMTGTPITATSAFTQKGFYGDMSYAVTSGTLPAGLTLDSATGVISGTPTAASSATITVTASGSAFGSATTAVTFSVTAPTVTFNANGGSGSMVSQSSAGPANLTANAFARSGFTFAGWNAAANGSGTAYANQAAYSFASSVTLYAQWTAVPAPPAPASEPVVDEASAPSPKPSPTPTVLGNLDPIPNQVNGNVPLAGVPEGQSLYLLAGVPTGVRVVPNAASSPTGLVATGDGFTMRLTGRGGNGDPLGLGGQAQLVLQSLQSGARSGSASSGAVCVVGTPVAESSGSGFKSGTPVKLYLLPGTTLGSFAVGADGTYAGSVPVPVGLPVGGQTLQVNGFAPSGAVRSVSLGVQVVPVRQVAARMSKAKVFFAPLSPVISDQGKRALDALAKKVGRSGKAGKRAVVVGFVQQTSSTRNDDSLSTRRARAVAAYLKSKGVKGLYQVRGEGIAGPGNDARRVNVDINYRPGC